MTIESSSNSIEDSMPVLEGASAAYRYGAGVALFGYINAFYHDDRKRMDAGNNLASASADPKQFYADNYQRAVVWMNSKKFFRNAQYSRKVEAFFDEAWANAGTFLSRRPSGDAQVDITCGFHDTNRWCKRLWQTMWEERRAASEAKKAKESKDEE